MNSIHNNGPDDQLLKDELDELGRAYQDIEAEGPPEMLDQAILNSAHRAVEGKNHWMDFGWIHGLTTAAVVVLALSIILTQSQPTSFEDQSISPKDSFSASQTGNVEAASKPDKLSRQSSELNFKTRKIMNNPLPAAASALEPESDLNDMPVTAAESRRELSEKKSVLLASVVLEDDLKQANIPVSEQRMEESQMRLERVGPSATPDRAKVDADIGQQERMRLSEIGAHLQKILDLKDSGDDRWKVELELFIENYPEYQLPKELKD